MEQLRLLLVDDDRAVAEMYSLQLTARGFSVRAAHSGEQALEMVSDDPPALIYLDLGLPEMSGLDVLERLRAAPETAAIPVVILTNYSEPELIARSKELGANDYLVKAHTTPAQLSETARRWTSDMEGDLAR